MMVSARGRPLRICAVFVDQALALAERPEELAGLRELGFDAILLPAEIWRACVFGEFSEDCGWSWRRMQGLVAALHTGGLKVFVAAEPGVFPIDHPLVGSHPDAFGIEAGMGGGGPLDPRRPQPAVGAARLRRSSPDAARRAVQAWTVAKLSETGAVGVQVRVRGGPGAVFWSELIAGLRQVRPDLAVIADTVGVEREEALELAGGGFDYLTSSLAWWDGRAAWLAEEYEALRPIAPLLADFTACEAVGAVQVRGLRLAPAAASGLVVRLADAPAMGEALRTANRLLEDLADFDGELRKLTGPAAPVSVLLRSAGPDLRSASGALLALVNPDLSAGAQVLPSDFLSRSPAALGGFRRLQGQGDPFAPLGPGEVRLLKASRARPVLFRPAPGKQAARAAAQAPRVAIEALSPSVDGGRFPVKHIVGEPVAVEADIFADGHEQLAARLLWRAADAEQWRVASMKALGDDRWRGEFIPERLGRHLFAVEGWLDLFGGFRRDFAKKLDASVAAPVDLEEGLRLVEAARARSEGGLRLALDEALAKIRAAPEAERPGLLLTEHLAELMAQADARPFLATSPAQPLDAERLGARFASWYELFPRSQTDDPARHGTFDDVIARLPAVKAMGFDVVYFPPIHPIGRKNRKGRNNSLSAGPDDPGSPYAIGSEEGGHDAVHPELGGLDAFERLMAAAHAQGLEVALDFAIQCAPDHPWLKAHPGWFDYRPDGSIKYAENPPKKYEDIVNVDFYKPDAVPSLWLALRDVVLFWVQRGVRLFRVDNPHTKPLPFWEWMIADVRGRHPDVVFLAEAFTRPKLMYRLAKLGFSQSYTYFTWRHRKAELTAYLTELTTQAPKAFFRPHFFVNTPDINPYFLQTSGRAGFLIRAALAATLSGLFGVYSGFELLEAEPVPGKEEYNNSEKYEIKPRDWNRPGNIVAEITRLNRIRKANPALQSHLGLTFYNAFNDNVLYYGKATVHRGDMVLVAVSLDPHHAQTFDFEIPLWEWGLPDDGTLEVEDLLHDVRFAWRGKLQRQSLTPDQPYAIWRVQPPRGA